MWLMWLKYHTDLNREIAQHETEFKLGLSFKTVMQNLSAIFVSRTNLENWILKSDTNSMLCFWNDKLSWLVMTISLNTTNQVVPATILQTYHHSDEPTIWLKIRINNIHHILIIGCTSMYLLFYCILMLHASYAIYHVTMSYPITSFVFEIACIELVNNWHH